MSGNIVSTSSTLNVGNSTSSTVNINSAATLNLGSTSGTVNVSPSTLNLGSTNSTVNIRGLPMLFTSNTSNFASITSMPAFVDGRPPAVADVKSYYMLPYTTTENLLIQWGYVADTTNKQVTFPMVYTGNPYVFGTPYFDGSETANLVIDNVEPSYFQIDTADGSSDRASFNWIAIGLKNK